MLSLQRSTVVSLRNYHYLICYPTLLCFGRVTIIISQRQNAASIHDTFLTTWTGRSRVGSDAHPRMSDSFKRHSEAERFLKIVPSAPNRKIPAWRISLIFPSQVSAPLYFRLPYPHDILSPLDPFGTALVHKGDIRANAFQALVSHDDRISRKLQLLILCYWL